MTHLVGIDSPYKGLVPYAEEDAEFFFGREAEREIIEANLIASRLTILYGESGVGKSSVLRAGVVYHLNEIATQNLHERSTPEFVVVGFNSWRDDPVSGLASCIYEAVLKTFKDQSIENVSSQSSLTELLQNWTKRLDCDLLIIFDQFEEYFLYHPWEDRSSFDTEFPRAVNHPDLRVNFLISIREDGLAKLDRFKGRIPSLFNNYLRLEHLDIEAARDAIEKPVKQYNYIHSEIAPITVDPALINAVLAQVQIGEILLRELGRGTAEKSSSKSQVECSYLQLVITRLWDEELLLNSHSLRLETLNRLGGAKVIVGKHLDRVMGNLSKKDQATVAVFFQYLVTPSGSKIAYPVADLLQYANRSSSEVVPIIKTLENERVLRHIPPPFDQPEHVRYEIYHDVLARAILDWRSRFLQSQTITKKVLQALVFVAIIIVVISLIYPFAYEAAARARAREQNTMLAPPSGSLTLQLGDGMQSVTVPGFAISTHPVANKSYALCIKVGTCTYPVGPKSTYFIENEDQPVVWLNVQQAASFCNWIGYRLPTAAEWQLAATQFGSTSQNDALFLFTDIWEWTSSYQENSSPAIIGDWNGQLENLSIDWIFIQQGATLDSSNQAEIYTNISGPLGASQDIGFRCVSQ